MLSCASTDVNPTSAALEWLGESALLERGTLCGTAPVAFPIRAPGRIEATLTPRLRARPPPNAVDLAATSRAHHRDLDGGRHREGMFWYDVAWTARSTDIAISIPG